MAMLCAGSCAPGEKAEEAPESVDTVSDLDLKKSEAQLTATPQNDLYSDGGTKLIKTANYRFQVESVKESTDAIIQSIRKYPAFLRRISM